jgi:hypothetical protein
MSEEKEFVISICKSIKTNVVTVQPVSWTEFIDSLNNPQSTEAKEKVWLFSPAAFEEDKRSKENATKLSMFVLDIDNPQVKKGKPPVTMEDVLKVLIERGLQHALASSWSHTEEHPKFRVILPLAHPIRKEYWHRWTPAALEATGLKPFFHAMDKSCMKNTAAIYYFPSAPDGDPWVIQNEGDLLDVPMPDSIKLDFSHIKFHQPRDAQASNKGDYTTLDVVRLFEAHDAYIKPKADHPGLHIVVCPWSTQHTDQKLDTATCVREGEAGRQWPSFQCMHDHCTGKTMKDVLEAWNDADRFCERPWDPMAAEALVARGEAEPGEGPVKVVIKKKSATGEEEEAPSPAAGLNKPLPSDGNKQPYTPDPTAECDDGFPTTIVELLKRYIYVSGMGKILDRKEGAFMAATDLKNTMSGRQFQTLTEGWAKVDFFKLPHRRMCTPSQITFNPGKKVDFPSINLFTGFHHDAAPALEIDDIESKVEATLTLLHYLCGEDTEYVLHWLAYPIIYPGAKMRSSLIIHGKQGIGKNLVFEKAMIGAYGKWGRLIDQRDLDAAFNGWISKKLYIIADEVATDKRKIDTSNLLKSWITGGTVSVNEKNLPVREEENHCNFVFLSNNSIPIFVDEDDRRYCVIRVPETPMHADFYQAVAEEIASTRGMAWYQFLKNLEVPRDFIRKPVPHNQAKADLKQSCKNSIDLFLDEFGCIEDDETQNLEAAIRGENEMRIAYGPAPTADLYRAYRIWCKWNGVNHPTTHRSFTMRGPTKRNWTKGRRPTTRFVCPTEVPFPETTWKLDELLEEFEKAVDAYQDRRGVQ